MAVRLGPALLLALLMLFARAGHAHSDALAWADPPWNGAWRGADLLAAPAWDDPAPRGAGQVLMRGAFACGTALLSHGFLILFNGFVTRQDWAFPTGESIRSNLAGNWRWEDRESFLMNHLGHPIQGSVYFAAARANGFGFYGSIFFNVFGSVTWEVFGESNPASINDFFNTVPSGMVLGEILFRLYLQALAAGVPAPLRFLISPGAAFQNLATGWNPPQVENNLYEFRAYLGGGWSRTDYSILGPAAEGAGFFLQSPFADVGVRIAYGDPFEQGTWRPFRHFEFFASFGSNAVNYQDFRIFADGYLFSFAPVHTARRAVSTGLSLHFDFAAIGEFNVYDSSINMYSSALSWTVKQRRLFQTGITWRSRSHAGFTFFGASKYHCPERWVELEEEFGMGMDLLNFGYGISLKHFSTVELGRRSRLDAHALFYFLWPYPGTSAISRGLVRWQFFDVAFSRLVSPRISLGASFSFARERADFDGFASLRKNHWAVRTFVAWNGQNMRGPGNF